MRMFNPEWEAIKRSDLRAASVDIVHVPYKAAQQAADEQSKTLAENDARVMPAVPIELGMRIRKDTSFFQRLIRRTLNPQVWSFAPP